MPPMELIKALRGVTKVVGLKLHEIAPTLIATSI